MIRRLFWLTAGAVLGVIGYRRLERLAHSAPERLLPGRLGRLPLTSHGRRELTRPAARELNRPGTRELPTGRSGFLRDVRDGMDQYLDRHAGQLGNTLVDQQAARGACALSATQDHYLRTAAHGVGRDSPSFP